LIGDRVCMGESWIPEADAPVNDAGDVNLTYFDDDLAKTITQDGVTTTFELDALARRTTSTITNNPTVTRHYGDDSDNPAWTTNSDGMTMRNAGSLDGLGAIVFGDGSAALTIGNPHGDNVTTVILPVGQAENTAAVSINGWADYDEYGVTKSNYPQGVTYGWLGKHERSASIESAGLTLMGVRLYNPIRGAFTSVDPVRGGNSTAYTYPQDPINMVDLDGRAKWDRWRKGKSFWLYAKPIRLYGSKNAAKIMDALTTVKLKIGGFQKMYLERRSYVSTEWRCLNKACTKIQTKYLAQIFQIRWRVHYSLGIIFDRVYRTKWQKIL